MQEHVKHRNASGPGSTQVAINHPANINKFLTSPTILIGLWGVPNLETHPCDWNHPKGQTRGDPMPFGLPGFTKKVCSIPYCTYCWWKKSCTRKWMEMVSSPYQLVLAGFLPSTTTFSLQNQLGVSRQPTQIHHLEAGFDGILKFYWETLFSTKFITNL